MRKLFACYHYFVLGTLLAFALFAVYYAVAGGVVHNADNASVLLEAHAMATGNLLLRHWSMPSDSFISSDIPIYALFELVVGIAPALMRLVPAILFTLAVLASCGFASWGMKGKQSPLAVLLTIALIGTPGVFLANEALLGPIHMGTIVFVMLAYLAYLRFFQDLHQPVRAGIWLVVFVMLTSAATLGDPLTLVIELLPIGLLSVGRIYAMRKVRSAARTDVVADAMMLGASLCAYGIALLMNAYLIHTGTHIARSSFVFVSATSLVANLTQTIESIVALFGADFFGQPLFRIGMIRTLLHLGACAIALIALLSVGKRLASGGDTTRPQHRLEALLWIAAVANVLAFALSTYPGGDITNARYLLPFFIFSGILGARVLSQFVLHERVNTLLAVVFALVLLGVFAHDVIARPPAPEPERAVVGLLESQGMESGYGQYWGSAIITVYSHGAVPIRQIAPLGSGMVPDLQLADAQWYQDNQPAHVVITSDFYTPPGFVSATVRAFGPYAKAYTIVPYHIYVWGTTLPHVH